jgi:hypothetical protein
MKTIKTAIMENRQITNEDVSAITNIIQSIDWHTVATVQVVELLKEFLLLGFVLPYLIPRVKAGFAKIKHFFGIKSDVSTNNDEIDEQIAKVWNSMTPEQKIKFGQALENFSQQVASSSVNNKSTAASDTPALAVNEELKKIVRLAGINK